MKIKLEYLLYRPEGYDQYPDKEWPLILFLHGAGETGDDLAKVKLHGMPKVVEEKGTCRSWSCPRRAEVGVERRGAQRAARRRDEPTGSISIGCT